MAMMKSAMRMFPASRSREWNQWMMPVQTSEGSRLYLLLFLWSVGVFFVFLTRTNLVVTTATSIVVGRVDRRPKLNVYKAYGVYIFGIHRYHVYNMVQNPYIDLRISLGHFDTHIQGQYRVMFIQNPDHRADLPLTKLHLPDSESWTTLPSSSNFIRTCNTPCDAGRCRFSGTSR